jgi:Zn-dependent protease with chaperone function
MTRRIWLAVRALLALVLVVCFYVLAIGVAVGLLWLSYVQLRSGRPAYGLVIFCLAGAASLLWSVVPRRDRFEPPGPVLKEIDHPELFALLREIGSWTSQPMPEDVYLINDVNAFVMQRGGMRKRRRVMGLGLPLMAILTVDEFKGVLTHEFGHFHAGDVMLGPWIHRASEAMNRTISQLAESVLGFIFVWYAKVFMRITFAVSRRQEFAADELAATLVGASAMAAALRKIDIAGRVHQSFWCSEIIPIVQAGFCPPFTWAFSRYVESPRISAFLRAISEDPNAVIKNGAYDTHPALSDRLTALARLPGGSPHDSHPSISLLGSIEGCEREVLASLSDDLGMLKPTTWPSVTRDVFLPIWRHRVLQHGSVLRRFAVGAPPCTRQQLVEIGHCVLSAEADDDRAISAAWSLLLATFAVALAPLGWLAETQPGEEVVFRRGSHELLPFSELQSVLDGHKSLTEWQARCAGLGIADVPMVADSELAHG